MKKHFFIVIVMLFVLLLVSCVQMDPFGSSDTSSESRANSEISFAQESKDDSAVSIDNSQEQSTTSENDVSLVDKRKYLKMHFIDVGQGDAIFMVLPNQQCMLIDAGDTANANMVVNYI